MCLVTDSFGSVVTSPNWNMLSSLLFHPVLLLSIRSVFNVHHPNEIPGIGTLIINNQHLTNLEVFFTPRPEDHLEDPIPHYPAHVHPVCPPLKQEYQQE